MATWMIKIGRLVTPLINLMDETQLAYDILQMDETGVQVLKEDGRAADAKSFMWVRRGGAPGQRIVLYDYASCRRRASSTTRAASVPMRVLQDYQGFLQSDGYAGYDAPGKRDGVIHVGCLAHARRKFFEAMKAQHAVGAAAAKGLAHQGLLLIRRIYAIDKTAREAKLKPEQRQKLRDKEAKPIWDELRKWLDANLGTAPPGSLTGKAMNYLASEWPRLIRVLDDGRLELDNNLCENAIRPFVMGRKAWLFSDTPAGAEASAKIYSLIETAKANGIEPYSYLKRVFTELPRAETLADFEALLPWSKPATQSVAA
jgi:transposase